MFTKKFHVKTACAGLLLLAAATVCSAEPTKVFQVVADGTTAVGDHVTIDNDFSNENPAIRLIVTPVFLSGYHNHVIGVSYDSVAKKWSIYNEDGTAMSTDGSVAFNVRATRPVPESRTFVALASALNSEADWTTFSRRGVTYNPDAILLLTHNFNPPHVAGVTHNRNSGVWFPGPRWAFYNEDTSEAHAVAFNVANVTGTTDAFVHQSTVNNVATSETTLDDPAANNQPDALLFVTHNYGNVGQLHDHPLGVYYSGTRWMVFNEDAAVMDPGVKFNVKIYPSAN